MPPIITYSRIQLCISGNVPLNPPVGELPAHTHTASTNTAGDHSHTFTFGRSYESDRGVPGGGDGDRTYTNSTNTAGSHIHTIAISNTGNNKAHNNMQPYIGVYLWQRTAQYAVGELPSHFHEIVSNTVNLTGSAGYFVGADSPSYSGILTVTKGSKGLTGGGGGHTQDYLNIQANITPSVNISAAGSNQSHENMPPFISIFCWKRIA